MRWRRWPGAASRPRPGAPGGRRTGGHDRGRPPPRAAGRDAAGARPVPHRQPDSLRQRFEDESPWWLREAAEDRIFERLLDGARHVLGDVASNPHHELRQDFDIKVPAGHGPPALTGHAGPGRGSSTSCWPSPSSGLGRRRVDRRQGRARPQAADPGSELRRRPGRDAGRPRPPAGRRPRPAARVEEGAETGSATWPSSSATRSPPWSAGRWPAGTAARPPTAWSCCSARTSSSSASTARWWAGWRAWSSTPPARPVTRQGGGW